MSSKRAAQVEEVQFTLKCKGLAAVELSELYRALAHEFPEHRPAFRNPFSPDFDANAVHEIMVCLTLAGGYIGKKVIEKGADIIAKIVEKKLAEGDGAHKKTVTIYGPDGKALYKIEAEPEKPKRRRSF